MDLDYALISHFHIVQYIITKDMASLLHALRNMAADNTWTAREKAVHYYAKKHIYLRFFAVIQDIVREENIYRRLIFGIYEQPQHTNDQDPKLNKIVNQYKYSYNHSYYNPDNPNLQYNHTNNTFVNNFNFKPNTTTTTTTTMESDITASNTQNYTNDDEEQQVPQITTLMVHSTIFARSLLEARTELLFATYTTELEDNLERVMEVHSWMPQTPAARPLIPYPLQRTPRKWWRFRTVIVFWLSVLVTFMLIVVIIVLSV